MEKQFINLLFKISVLFVLLIMSCNLSDEEWTATKTQSDSDNSISKCEISSKDIYSKQLLFPKGIGCDFHGLAFDKEGSLYVGVLLAPHIYKFNIKTGEYVIFEDVKGQSDDMDFSEDGTLYWTSLLAGKIYAKKPGGNVKQITEGYFGFNPITFNAEGRLFVATMFVPNPALYEIDPNGINEPRYIMDISTNGFDFGPDGLLYAPLGGTVVSINIETKEIKPISNNFILVNAVKFDSKGNLFVCDAFGEIAEVDIATGEKTTIAVLDIGCDNLAISPYDENIAVSNYFTRSIWNINIASGAKKCIFRNPNPFVGIGDIDLYEDSHSSQMHVADFFSYQVVDPLNQDVLKTDYWYLTPVLTAVNIEVNNKHTLISGFFTASVQKLDKQTGECLLLSSGLKFPNDLVELNDGSILIAEGGTGSIKKISNNNTQIVVDGFVFPMGLVMEDQRTGYVTDALAGKVYKIDINNRVKYEIASGLVEPEGIDLLDSHRLIIAETGKDRVISMNLHTGKYKILATSIPMGQEIEGTPCGVLSGITVSKDKKTIYVSSDIDNTIYKLEKK